MKMLPILMLSIVALVAPACIAGDNAGSFLDIKVGARAMGMGGAFTAIANDGSAIYWNPAGLSSQSGINFFSSIMTTSAGKWNGLSEIQSRHYFLSIALPLKNIGVVGFGLKHFSIDDIEIRSSDNDSWTSTGQYFDNQESAFYVSYGRQLIQNLLSIGVGIVSVQQQFSFASEASAFGFGLNIGMLFKINQIVTIGFKVDDNITMHWKYGDSDEIPFKAKSGVALNLLNNHLTIAADLEQRRDLPLKLNSGFEYFLNPEFLETGNSFNLKGISFRGGIDNHFIEQRSLAKNEFDSRISVTFGFGLSTQISKLSFLLDYSYGQYSLGAKNRISLSLII